jgi:ketosteroid isomerase-like protein
MQRVLAHHADDIVMFDVPLPLQPRGMDEYRKTWESFFANNPVGPGSFDVTELQITASDTLRIAPGLAEDL